MQKTLMVVATTAVGFAFGLWAYNKFIVGKAMVSQGAPATSSKGVVASPSMPIPTASSSPDMGL